MKLSKTYIDKEIVLFYKKNDNFIGKVVAKNGVYEPFESKTILENIKEGDQVINVGANIGYHSLLMANKVGPKGAVYAFEPDPESYSILKKNISANHFKNIKAFPIALSSKKEKKTLFLSKVNFGDNRLFKHENEKVIGGSVIINADSLDNILKRERSYRKIQLIKIDTQGYEPFVVAGASRLLKRDKPLLFLEYWPYGYRRIRADEKAMIDFLNKIYGNIYMVDNRYGSIYRTNYQYIKRYCEQVNGTLYCDVLFKKESLFSKIKHFILDKKNYYLNIPYQLGTDINFGINGNASYYQKNGWSYPEDNFNWTEGKTSTLIIPLKKYPKKIRLQIIARPLIFKKTSDQRLIITANNRKILDKKISNQEYALYEMELPINITKDRKKILEIIFRVPKATSPYRIGMNEDKRILGLAVKKMNISAI